MFKGFPEMYSSLLLILISFVMDLWSQGNELMDNFNTSQFTVRMSRDTYTQLRLHDLQVWEKNLGKS